jgi:hypothetical protein
MGQPSPAGPSSFLEVTLNKHEGSKYHGPISNRDPTTGRPWTANEQQVVNKLNVLAIEYALAGKKGDDVRQQEIIQERDTLLDSMSDDTDVFAGILAASQGCLMHALMQGEQ